MHLITFFFLQNAEYLALAYKPKYWKILNWYWKVKLVNLLCDTLKTLKSYFDKQISI